MNGIKCLQELDMWGRGREELSVYRHMFFYLRWCFAIGVQNPRRRHL